MIIIGYEDGKWIVKLAGLSNTAIFKTPGDLRIVPDHWLQTTRSGQFDQIGMLQHFQAPRLSEAVPKFDENFLSRANPPSTTVCTGFWGEEVYKFMYKCSQYQLSTQRKLKTLWHFTSQHAQCCVVFSDGTKATQEMTYHGEYGSWWPALYVVADVNSPGKVVVYCQAQALCTGRAWLTDASRVVRLREATQATTSATIVPLVIVVTLGVQISEISDSDSDDYEWV